MIGYYYGSENSAYWYLTYNYTGFLSETYRSEIYVNSRIGEVNTADGIKRYRSWVLGGDSSLTTETGNNEHSKKYSKNNKFMIKSIYG